ncbi:acyl carrier protein [Arenibacter sp. F26102]|uniref:acyl carrier protein n=1 Tax=Arenibacter sp. F26102 TaxID=2926416 RepID=UPI001FF5613E|nr:acyl carrier protein [Arenibacter sp. F26102]MCK0148115.1 acyl carrier protein [Arenibacter sp. F26102]
MNEILIKYISEDLLNNELEEVLDPHDDLLGSGILDSLGMMKLILFIELEYSISVPPQDMIIENFMSVSHITTYLSNKDQS